MLTQELIDKIINEIDLIDKNFTTDFDIEEIKSNIYLAYDIACCSCDIRIVALLTMHYLTTISQLPYYKSITFFTGRQTKSEKVGDLSVAYGDGDGEYGEFDGTKYGKMYKQLCMKRKKSFIGIGIAMG